MNDAREEGKLLSAAEAAEILGTTVGTLACWRCTKAYDLPYVKIGALVRYRLNDLRDWIARRSVNLPAAEPKRPRRVRVHQRTRGRRRAA
jgi:predicted DNA-binding transcriptional regulator AlpA